MLDVVLANALTRIEMWLDGVLVKTSQNGAFN